MYIIESKDKKTLNTCMRVTNLSFILSLLILMHNSPLTFVALESPHQISLS